MKNIFCIHDYELIHEVTTESEFEVMARYVTNMKGNFHIGLSRYYIQIFKCKKCNNLKRYVQLL